MAVLKKGTYARCNKSSILTAATQNTEKITVAAPRAVYRFGVKLLCFCVFFFFLSVSFSSLCFWRRNQGVCAAI